MIKIDHQLLVETGLGHLEKRQQNILLRRIHDVLEMRTGLVIADSLTTAQRDTFERLLDRDRDAAQSYLERAVPHYSVVVRSELDFIANSIAQRVREETTHIDQPTLHD
jgi:hypothetical protein